MKFKLLANYPSNFQLIMKLTLFLVVAFSIQVSARAVAQLIRLDVQNQPLKDVLQELRKQSGYSFIYRDSELSKANSVTLHVEGKDLADVLPLLFEGQPLTYEIDENIINILPRAVAAQRPATALPSSSSQQPNTVKGRVTDSFGNGLQGASIRVLNAEGKRTTLQTTTDEAGYFLLRNVPEEAQLEVTYVGYVARTIHAGADIGAVVLTATQSELNPVDVVYNKGYYNESRRMATGSVGRVSEQEIARQPVANPIAALQGRIPGLEITQTSGRADANFNVLIRGKSSIANGNEPLYIIDGVPWLSNGINLVTGWGGAQSPFNSINPADIASIEVLKDADATAIYGSRGANGVILITTKKGTKGKTEINLNAQTGISEVGHTMPLMNTAQYVAMRNEALANDGLTPSNTNAPDLLLYDQRRYTDWTDVLIGNTAKQTDVQLSMSGGNSNTQFRLAGAYRRETNVYPGDEANKRGSGQFNLTHRSDNEKLRASLTVNYSSNDNNLPPNDLTLNIYSVPNLKVYEDDGSLAWYENGSAGRSNPLSSMLYTFNTLTNNLVSNLNLDYEIMKGLHARINAGYTNTETNETSIMPLASYLPSASPKSGWSEFANVHFRSWIIEPQLNYNKQIGGHSLDVLLGSSWQEELLKGTSIMANDYSSEALLHTTTGAATLTTTENYGLYRYQSVFARINYQYRKRYLVNFTGRRDGSSRFGPNRQFANFGAIGAAWLFADEDFIENHLSWLSFGKIRGSYGLTGNDKIGNYQFMDTYGSRGYPYNGVAGLAAQRLFNPNYEWESNRKLEFALELGFLKDRIFLSSGWFKNRSGNQLLQYTLPSQTGFSGIIRNLPALVENKGWELELNTINLQHTAFKWNTSFNMTIATNKLLEFPDLESSSYASSYAIGESLNIVKVYPYSGVDPETGVWTMDLAAGRNVIKDLTPKFYGGFNNSFQYHGFQLDVFFQFVKKEGRNYLYSLPALPGLLNYNMPVALEGRWHEKGESTEIQRFGTTGDASTSRRNYLLSEGVYTDASFIRLKNVALSYTLPTNWSRKLAANDIRIYSQAQNLFTITGYEGNDPEVTSMTTLPPLRTVTFGFQITF